MPNQYFIKVSKWHVAQAWQALTFAVDDQTTWTVSWDEGTDSQRQHVL
jgi:hypothetical protein